MKNILYTSLIFFSLNLLAQTAEQPSGSGTETDPYLVGTLNNLYWITENSGEWDQYYVQTSDIDASSTSAWDGGQGFTPVGNNSSKFAGSYDGSVTVLLWRAAVSKATKVAAPQHATKVVRTERGRTDVH